MVSLFVCGLLYAVVTTAETQPAPTTQPAAQTRPAASQPADRDRHEAVRRHHEQARLQQGLAPLSREQWADLLQARTMLRDDFEASRRGRTGRVAVVDLSSGGNHALMAEPTETHWARRAGVQPPGSPLRATANTWLLFRYRITRDIPLTIYIFDPDQKDNLRYDIGQPVVGKWTDVAVNVSTDFRRNDGSPGKCRPGDMLRSISFLAGTTGRDEFGLAVDDVEVIGLD